MLVGLAVAASAAAGPSAASAAPAGDERRAGAPAAPAPSDLQTETLAPGRTPGEEKDRRLGPRPRFIEPAATTTEHTRLGLSAWITQGAPFERRENPGGVALGFTIAWPPPKAERPPSGHP
jgi:hypothetical protein